MRKKTPIKILTALMLMGFSGYASSSPVEGVIGIGYDFGGDTLGTAFYTDGSTQKIKSHEGLSIYGGADMYFGGSFKARGTVGYKFTTTSASNGEVSFSRVPFDLVIFNNLGPHSFGIGGTYHTAVEFECVVPGSCNGIASFDDSFGLVFQYEYAFDFGNNTQVVLGAKYTNIEYTAKATGETVDSGGAGVTLGFLF